MVRDVQQHQWANLVFAGLNLTLSLYAMVAFVGVGNTIVDLLTHLRNWLYRPVKASRKPAARSTATPAAPTVCGPEVSGW